MTLERILILTPPGSMRRVVAELRHELYRRTGCVSALALPPVVPLLAWRLELPVAEAAGLLASCARPLRFRLDSYARVAGCLYLGLASDAPDGIEGLTRDLDRASAAAAQAALSGPSSAKQPPRLIPLSPGFFMAGPDLAATPRELALDLPIPSERAFSSYCLSVLRVCSHAPASSWWRVLSWAEEVRVPVKSSGRAAPGSAARSPRGPTGGGRAPAR